MALSLNTISLEPIFFDGQAYTPEMTVERRLRLARASSGGDLNEELLNTIANCFGDKNGEVREKLKGLSVNGICELQVYLLNGDAGVEEFRKRANKNSEEKENA